MLFPQRTRPLCRQAPPFPKLCFLHLTCPARWHQLRTSAPRSRTRASGASEPRGPASPSASDPPGPQGEDAGWGSCSAPPGTQHHGARAAGPGSAGEAVGSWAEPPARRPTSQCPSLLHSAPLSQKRPPGLLSCSGFRHSQESTGGLSALTLLPGQETPAPSALEASCVDTGAPASPSVCSRAPSSASQGPGASAWATRDPRRSLGQSSSHFPSASSGPRPPWKTT